MQIKHDVLIMLKCKIIIIVTFVDVFSSLYVFIYKHYEAIFSDLVRSRAKEHEYIHASLLKSQYMYTCFIQC